MIANTSKGTLFAAGSAILVAAALGQRLLYSRSAAVSSLGDIDELDDIAEEDYITPEDVVKVFDALFLHMQQVVAQLSKQIQQIQAAGQMIPEPQLRQLLKAEFERALLVRQSKVFEDHDVDEDCLREATFEFMAKPEEYPKVKKSVERFQKLYENVSGESVVGASGGDGGKKSSDNSSALVVELKKEKLLQAATVYFEALTEAMREIVQKFKSQGLRMNDMSVAQRLHMEFASVANEAGEAALKRSGVTIESFRAAIEKHSGDPDVGRTLTMLQMQQQQELIAMGVPTM